MQHLENRTAVVTGAASGIGLALTESFVARGMNVVMADIEEPALVGQAQRLEAAGAKVLALSLIHISEPARLGMLSGMPACG